MFPLQTRAHVSLEGHPLDPDLKNFYKNARERRGKYMDCFLVHEKAAGLDRAGPPRFSIFPVFVTEDEKIKYTAYEISQFKT